MLRRAPHLLLLAAALSTACGSKGATHGDFSIFAETGWIDTHVHLRSHHQIDPYVAYQDRLGMDRMAIQVLPIALSLTDGHRPNRNAEALLAKARHPDRFYVFGGLDLTRALEGDEALLAEDLRAQVELLDAAGVDGIKIWLRTDLVEGFAQATSLSLLLDSPAMSGALAAIEQHDLPVLLHLDAQYASAGYAAMEAHPGIRWFVTHMAIATGGFQRVEEVLALSEQITIDVGHYVFLGELLRHDPQGASAFFERQASRVLLSSDLGAGCGDHVGAEQDCPDEAAVVDAAWTLRAMVETTEELEFVSVFDDAKVRVKGLGLPAEQLRLLYQDNALARLGPPRALDCAAALAVVDQLRLRTVDPDQQLLVDELRAELAGACG